MRNGSAALTIFDTRRMNIRREDVERVPRFSSGQSRMCDRRPWHPPKRSERRSGLPQHRRLMTGSSAANPSMRSAACPFCEYINSPDSKFCDACGTPLQLVPCARCGAVNHPTATSCHQCAAALPEDRPDGLARSSSATEAADAAGSGARTTRGTTRPITQPSLGAAGLDRDARLSAALQELKRLLADSDSGAVAGRPDGKSLGTHAANADVRRAVSSLADALRSYPASAIAGSPAIRVGPRIVPRRGLAVIVGTVVFAVLAAAGYYAYRERPVPQVPRASGVVKDSGSPAAAGALVNPSVSGSDGVPSASTPTRAVMPPVAADARPIAPAREGSATAIRSGTAPPGDARSPATAPFARSSGGTTTRAQRPDAQARDSSEAATPVPTGAARPRPADAAPGILERQPPRVGPCTDAIAALGLCAPEAIQRRE